MLWMRFATALLLYALGSDQALPAGTVIPVMISTGLNAAKDEPGKKIEGSVMQLVPLPSGGKIDARARITGHVVSVGKAQPSGATMVLKFDTIEDHGRTIPLTVALLAVASSQSVAEAQAPIEANSDLEPVSQWVTRQVGGDVVNRGRGKVASHDGVVGTWVEDSSVLVRLTPNPKAGCPSGPGYDREQATWIFSSAACGTYGLNDATVASSGRTSPLGEITLKGDRNIAIRGGSGWLLITLDAK
jgi:hypothetical protein